MSNYQQLYPIAFLVLFLAILFSKKFMNNRTWRATMTPLASIIGSGFLIAAPLLDKLGGDRAPFLMLTLCAVSFAIGEVIRWNITSVEPLNNQEQLSGFLKITEKFSDWALAFAYILSITYYLYLFSSFFLKATGHSDPYIIKAIAVAVFFSISYFGHQNGLDSLEKIEGIAVNIKLSIIITFIGGLLAYNWMNSNTEVHVLKELPLGPKEWANLFGLLIMVQGFETSRYLGEKYDAKTRVKSMRYSQIISSLVYLSFIFLFIPVFQAFPLTGEISETSVIDVGKHVFFLAPVFLLTAAIASQLSAAVADLGGAGGLISELTNKKISSKNGYLIICFFGCLIIVTFDIFRIISLASKAFAIYYFFQCLSSSKFYFNKKHFKFVFSLLCAVLCLLVVIFGTSFE